MIRNKILADNLVESFHIIIFIFIPFVYLGVPKLKAAFSWIAFFLLTVVISILIYFGVISPFWNLIYFITYPLLFYFVLTEREKLYQLGFNFKFWKDIILYSAFASIILVAHLLFVVSLIPTEQISFLNIFSKLPEILTETGFSIIGMEIFYRGFIFSQLYKNIKFPFGIAALISTLFYVLPFFTNQIFLANIAIGFATTFYAAILGFIFCYLYKKTDSLWASFITSFILFITRIIILH